MASPINNISNLLPVVGNDNNAKAKQGASLPSQKSTLINNSANTKAFNTPAFVKLLEDLVNKLQQYVSDQDNPPGGKTTGGPGDDVLRGGPGADYLSGKGGNDQLFGAGGDDHLSGGQGDDDLHGGKGNDNLKGGNGSDILKGGSGDDTLKGGSGSDLLEGGKGSDILKGGRGNDTLDGGSGSDLLKGGDGDDILNGGSGNDTLKGGNGSDILESGSGDDILNGGSGSDLLKAGDGSDILKGGKGDDTLEGGSGSDLLKGGDGNDILSGGNDNDTLNGGSGSDLLEGGKGDDILKGGEGNDILRGGAGYDELRGGDGDDSLTDNQGSNKIDGGAGYDTVNIYGNFGDYDISQSGEGFALTNTRTGEVNKVINVESFQFNDVKLDADSLIVSPKLGDYRSIDGSGNNQANPDFGKADSPFFRLLPQDASREPGGATEAKLPSPREISNIVSAQTGDTENSKGLSDMFWLWGQFMDHDINRTPADGSSETGQPTHITVPEGDAYFDPHGTGSASIEFFRSDAIVDADGNRQQSNAITAFIDGSNVYGSTPKEVEELRADEGGKLKVSEGNLLPLITEEGRDKGHFNAGDERANEHGGLTSMHTLWVREHNQIAEDLAYEHPDWDNDKLYEEARSKVGAEIQAITYNEFLPLLLGDNAPGDYQGYDAGVDPQVSNSFATAAYRFGHSMLSPDLLRLDENGQSIDEGEGLPLRDAFFQPARVKEAGIEPFLRGFAQQTAQALDPQIVDDVRNFLFGEPGGDGLDLASLNIQRGRDHGLPGYNDAREALGLERITSFEDPIFTGDFGEKLAQVYEHPDDIDLWVAGLAEQKDSNGMVGETMSSIISDQFERSRSGDSFWYENRFEGNELKELNNLTLADVISRNTGIENLQANVMVSPSQGSDISDTAEVVNVVDSAGLLAEAEMGLEQQLQEQLQLLLNNVEANGDTRASNVARELLINNNTTAVDSAASAAPLATVQEQLQFFLENATVNGDVESLLANDTAALGTQVQAQFESLLANTGVNGDAGANGASSRSSANNSPVVSATEIQQIQQDMTVQSQQMQQVMSLMADTIKSIQEAVGEGRLG